MQLKVTLPGDYTLFSLTDAATFIACLANSRSVRTSGWGDNEKHEHIKEQPTLTIVPDDYHIEAIPAPLVELQAQLRTSETRWLEHYTANQKLTKELKETKAELERIQATVASSIKPTTQAPSSNQSGEDEHF